MKTRARVSVLNPITADVINFAAGQWEVTVDRLEK
jgi:hypothetical protein